MQDRSTGTDAKANSRAAEAALSITRILAGAYFLASAAALAIFETGPALMQGLLGTPLAQNLTAALLLVASSALLMRRSVRIAALVLVLHVLLTGMVRIGGGIDIAAIAADFLLLNALLLLAAGEPATGTRAMPRRVPAATRPAATPRPDPETAQQALAAVQAVRPNRRNLFADLWNNAT